MELQDGFIIGIYNYCDRWCETCRFTSRCRVFADCAETEAGFDPHFKALIEAPPVPEDVPVAPPRWMQELIDEMNEAASEPLSKEELARLRPPVAAEHRPIEKRARAYGRRVTEWLTAQGLLQVQDTSGPVAVIHWFALFISAKVHRALTGLAAGWEHDGPPDHDGSAKAALVAIERSHAAWLEVGSRGTARGSDVAEFIADLVWLGVQIEQVFPAAQSFVRPAFDEPEELAKLLADQT